MIMKNYVADELSNKVYHLHKALNQAEKIIATLEEENQFLKNALSLMGDDHIQEIKPKAEYQLCGLGS